IGVRTASTITTSRPLPFCIRVSFEECRVCGVCSTQRRGSAPGATVQDRLTGESTRERLGILGTGAIACGLALLAAESTDGLVWGRREASAASARGEVGEGARVVCSLDEMSDHALVVEAVIEDLDAKTELMRGLSLD